MCLYKSFKFPDQRLFIIPRKLTFFKLWNIGKRNTPGSHNIKIEHGIDRAHPLVEKTCSLQVIPVNLTHIGTRIFFITDVFIFYVPDSHRIEIHLLRYLYLVVKITHVSFLPKYDFR